MKQLVDNGEIGQNVFSAYYSMKEGKTTHLKFGGWDKEAVAYGT